MIKQFCFVSRRAEISLADFHSGWAKTVARSRDAPRSARPVRSVVCTTLPDTPGSDAPHDAVSILTFAELDLLQRCEVWLSEHGLPSDSEIIAPEQTVRVVAEEVVLRGSDWLAQRWAAGGLKYKHMALARRALGLSTAEFSARWRSRAGRIGGSASAPVIEIPRAAKGCAYIQNHPLALPDRDNAYDAITEVYFDDLGGMSSRLEFFRDHDPRRADGDLVREACFIVVMEELA